MRRSGFARIVAGIGAATGAFSLTLQYVSLYADMSPTGASALDVLWYFFAFFTVLTNFLVTAIFARAVLRPRQRDGLNSPRVEAVGVTSIVLVGVVYHALLAGSWQPQGAGLLADTLLHSAMPLIFIGFWLLRPHGSLGIKDALYCAIWPATYAVYSLTRGALDGWYPYYFLDASLGVVRMVANLAGILALFLLGAIGLIGIDRELAKVAR